MKKSHAFSLAEVLTTLMIIGVIAAFLIPVLTTGIEKQKTVSMLKRLYSSFSVNIQTVLGEANCSSVSCLRAYPSGEVSYAEKDIVVDDVDEDGNITGNHKEYRQTKGHVFANPKYFHVLGKCNNCISNTTYLPTTVDLNNDPEREKYEIYRLNNGAIMALYSLRDEVIGHDEEGKATYGKDYSNKGNCTNTNRMSVNGQAVNLCGIVVFDVNGTKGPNQPGKDLFAFYITDEAVDNSYIVPIGYVRNKKGKSTYNKEGLIQDTVGTCKRGEDCYNEDGGVCSPGETRSGYNCTASIMLEGWKIKY